MVNANGEVAGELFIGCATTSGRYFIPNLLAAFQQDYPHVRTNVSLIRRQDAMDGLLEQSLNFGVIGRKVEHRDLESLPLLDDRVVLIVPAHHPWANLKQVKPADVLEQPFITRETNSGTFDILFDNMTKHGIDPANLNVVMQLGDAEAVQMAVEKGIGITFISEMMVARSLALGKVKKVAVEGFNMTQRVYLVRHVSNTFTSAETKLWEFVKLNHDELAAELLTDLSNVTMS